MGHFDSIIINQLTRAAGTVAVVLALFVATAAHAQTSIGGWTRTPTILVIGQQSDPRYAMVREAVDHWNATLASLGSGFRWGEISIASADIPRDFVIEVGAARDVGRPYTGVPPGVLNTLPADYILILSEENFVSFGGLNLRSGKRVGAIQGLRNFPLRLPNVALNVIVHELGHGLGMEHNADPAALMCGRPAPCRPSLFQFREKKIFPLLESDKAALLKLYPPDWKPLPQ